MCECVSKKLLCFEVVLNMSSWRTKSFRPRQRTDDESDYQRKIERAKQEAKQHAAKLEAERKAKQLELEKQEQLKRELEEIERQQQILKQQEVCAASAPLRQNTPISSHATVLLLGGGRQIL